MEIKSFNELISAAIKVHSGMLVHWPQYGENEQLQLTNVTTRNKQTYNWNNGVTVIVDNELNVYVIPSMRIVSSILRDMGYKENFGLYVPFSNGDYPVLEKAKWDNLRKFQVEQRKVDFVNDCNAFCDKNEIGTIDEKYFDKCFEMPETGVPVKHPCWEETYYPAITGSFLDCVAVDKLGKYTYNNGTIAFVYRDGKTYVTRDYNVLGALRAAGYKEGSLFVPFSNGETIAHVGLGARWFHCTH